MNGTPKGNRLQIGIFGRINTGKSSLLNLFAGQHVAITSPVRGTTTDVVEKAMELLPIGPVLFLDTAGIDDDSPFGISRAEKATQALDRSDLAIIVAESGIWGPYEQTLIARCRTRRTPVLVVVNKCDLALPSPTFLDAISADAGAVITVSCARVERRDEALEELKAVILKLAPGDRVQPPLVSDLIPAGGVIVMVVPIDLQAPKGRLILPQVQTIRETLDVDATAIVVKERELAPTLQLLNRKPDLVVCDSQSILKVDADVPRDVRCTTFSILFARAKGDLAEAARGAAHIARLRPGSAVLVAEGCTHHALEDDIGRVKIPRWLRNYVGGDVDVSFVSGCAFPKSLPDFDLVVHCGGCTLNRTEMLSRVETARSAGVPITNYGMTISFVQGVLPRVLAPFPAALDAFDQELASLNAGQDLKAQPC